MITSVLKTLANNVKVVYRALINSDGDEINPATEDGNLATLAGTVSNQKVGVDIGSALVSVDLAEVDVDAILDGIAGSGTPKTLADLYATTYNDTATAGLADLMYSAGAGESVAELLYDGSTSAVDHLASISTSAANLSDISADTGYLYSSNALAGVADLMYDSTAGKSVAEMLYNSTASESVAELLHDGSFSAVDHLAAIDGNLGYLYSSGASKGVADLVYDVVSELGNLSYLYSSGASKSVADLVYDVVSELADLDYLYSSGASKGVADLLYNSTAMESVAELLYDGTTSAVDHLSDIAGDTDATRSYAMQISSRVGGENSAAATAGSEGSLSAKMRLVTSQLDAISTDIAAIKAVTDVLQFDGSNRLKVETTAAP